MKNLKTDNSGLNKKDYDAGTLKLETFKIKDKLDHDTEKGKHVATKREQVKFEKDLIAEAQLYAVEASKRLVKEQGERKTTRKSLAEIYKKMKELHPRVIE